MTTAGDGRPAYERAPEQLANALAQAREALRSARLAPPPDDESPIQGHGEAVGGLVRATAERGRLTTVEIDPRAMRMPSEDLGRAVTEASNAALADLEQSSTESLPPLPDAEALDAQLEELQNTSVQQLGEYTRALTQIMSRFGELGRR